MVLITWMEVIEKNWLKFEEKRRNIMKYLIILMMIFSTNNGKYFLFSKMKRNLGEKSIGNSSFCIFKIPLIISHLATDKFCCWKLFCRLLLKQPLTRIASVSLLMLCASLNFSPFHFHILCCFLFSNTDKPQCLFYT